MVILISTIGKTITTDEEGGAATISAIHPDIIQTHILTCLDGPSLASASSTCSQLNNLSSNEHLWNKICHSTWPSTNTTRVRHVISTFPNTSRSFFSDSFSTVTANTLHHRHHHHRINLETTPEILSAVDLFHRKRLILSKVVETETVSGWFRCSPFRIDILDPKDSVETSMEYPRNDEECKNLEEELRLSWIVIDPRGKRAVNVSSGKPVSVHRHWLTGDVHVKFATVLHGGEKGSATEVTVCSLLVTLGGEMQVREVCFQVEDMDGINLNGRDSLGILQKALEGGRKRLRSEKEGKERFVEFMKRRKKGNKEVSSIWNCWFSYSLGLMAMLASSPSTLLFSASSSKLLPLSNSSTLRLSFSSSLHSSSLSISSTILSQSSITSKRFSNHATFSINASAAVKKKVLIINTNSGGHAVIGFYFAKELLGAGHSVTILTVGDESSDKMKKPPFNRFSEIVSAGGSTVWGNPADVGSIVGGEAFDVVLDNNGKDLEAVRPVIDWAKSSGAKQFLFISSAGIYKTTDEPPHVEGDAVKADAGHVGVEKYIEETFDSWAIFRPQYMLGSGNNKDCEEWFFDRIVRDRPVLIPGSGLQLTNIAHVRDLSAILTLAVENPDAASHSIFNLVSDRAVTLNGIAKLCAQAAGRPVNIVHYDPKAIGIDAKKAFPFRTVHFYAEPRAAKTKLGWSSTTNLPEDLKERFEEYVKIGRDKKDIKFELDDKILEALKVPVPV